MFRPQERTETNPASRGSKRDRYEDGACAHARARLSPDQRVQSAWNLDFSFLARSLYVVAARDPLFDRPKTGESSEPASVDVKGPGFETGRPCVGIRLKAVMGGVGGKDGCLADGTRWLADAEV